MDAAPDLFAEANRLVAAGRGEEAVRLVQARASGGDALAFFTLADWRLRGTALRRDYAAARDMFGRAGEGGIRPAAWMHTNLLASSLGGPPDWPAAVARLRIEAREDPGRAAALALIDAMALTPEGEPATLPEARRLSASPDLLHFPALLSAGECDYLIRRAEGGYAPSVVVDTKTGREIPDPVRTSEGSTIHLLIEDPAVRALNRRLAAASGTAVEQGEPLQILRYRPGDQYRRHVDTIPGRANQRIATILVWLNEDYRGGETLFTRLGRPFRGRAGDAIVFRNVTPDGRPDPASEHAGLPVTAGVKLLASRWICEKPTMS